ncbi:hypothetical protein D3C84_1061970 [compost metagenome]
MLRRYEKRRKRVAIHGAKSCDGPIGLKYSGHGAGQVDLAHGIKLVAPEFGSDEVMRLD